EPRVPSFVLDLRETTRPVLHPLVEQLLADERLAAYADALPAPARVSESALPLLLAALHEQLARALVVVLPAGADARDAAEGARAGPGGRGGARSPGAGAPVGAGGGTGRRPSWAGGPGRGRCSPRAGSSAPPRPRGPSRCHRPKRGRRRSRSRRERRRGSSRS